MEKTSYDTIIIGAGLAGISAARTLIQNGVKDILVLEGNGNTAWLETQQVILTPEIRHQILSSRTSRRTCPYGIYPEFSV